MTDKPKRGRRSKKEILEANLLITSPINQIINDSILPNESAFNLAFENTLIEKEKENENENENKKEQEKENENENIHEHIPEYIK